MARTAIFLGCSWLLLVSVARAEVLPSLAPHLVNHYTFDNPLLGELDSTVELDLGSDATPIQLLNGAPRVADSPWDGGRYSLETAQRNTGPNDDWKAGVMFDSSGASTLSGTNHVTATTIMGWFKPLGTEDDNPSPNTNTSFPFDRYNAFGLAGILRGDDNFESTDGHTVRVLLEVIGGKVTALGRRLDDQNNSGQTASLDDWEDVMPPGQWTHLTATFDFDEGDVRLYKNGLPLESTDPLTSSWDISEETDYTSATDAGGIKIGGSYPDNSEERNPFNGRMDELMFFNTWLTAADVAAQYSLVSGFAADFDGDVDVDSNDLATWQAAYGADNTADADGDGDSDGRDFLIWQRQFGGGVSSVTEITTVPEPGAQICATLMLLFWSVKRKQFGQERKKII